MTLEYWLVVLGAFMTLVGATPQIIEKFYHLPPSSPEEQFEINKGKRIAIISIVFIVFGAAVSLVSSINSISEKEESQKTEDLTKQENRRLTDSLLSSQARIVKLSNQQLDSALNILELSRALHMTQQKLETAQQDLIDKQNKDFEIMTGGDNRPVISIYQGYSFYAYRDPTERAEIYLRLKNKGNTILKDVEVFVDNPYRNYDKIQEEFDSSFYSINSKGEKGGVIYGPFRTTTFAEFYSRLDQNTISHSNVGVLLPNAERSIGKFTQPLNSSLINYTSLVTWSNGGYVSHISAKIHNKNFVLRFIKIYENGHLVKDQQSYFHQSNPIPDKYIRCSDVNYKGEIYEVYWYNNQIFYQIPGSIFVGKTFSEYQKDASNTVKILLEQAYGK